MCVFKSDFQERSEGRAIMWPREASFRASGNLSPRGQLIPWREEWKREDGAWVQAVHLRPTDGNWRALSNPHFSPAIQCHCINQTTFTAWRHRVIVGGKISSGSSEQLRFLLLEASALMILNLYGICPLCLLLQALFDLFFFFFNCSHVTFALRLEPFHLWYLDTPRKHRGVRLGNSPTTGQSRALILSLILGAGGDRGNGSDLMLWATHATQPSHWEKIT